MCLAIALALGAPTMASAQAVGDNNGATRDFSDWACERCPDSDRGWFGDFDFGIGWISDDSLRYGNYRGHDEKGGYLALSGEGGYRDAEGNWVEFSANELDVESRQIHISGGREGVYELRMSWQEIPSWRGYGAQTPYRGQGSDNLTLPSDWVDGTTTGQMTALQSSLVEAPMKIERKTLDAGATIRFAGDWTIEIDAQRQDKSGTRPFGGAGIFYNNAAQILAPVDFTTDNVELGINWNRETFQLSLGFLASEFDNGHNSLTWDNAFTSTPETSVFRAALEPSNEFYQFSLTGAWAIRPGMHLSGHAAIGEMSQDEAFLPYSINPDFGDLSLPRASLDGRVDTSTANLGGKYFWRINSRLSLNASAKYNERDNRTPIDTYTPVLMDFIDFPERQNRPYGYERTQYEADLRFKAMRKLRLSGGVKFQDLDRTWQSIENSEETTLWGEARFTPTARMHFKVSYEEGERDTSEYQAVTDSGRVDHPLFRKFNQADRDRSKGQLEAFASIGDGVGINLTVYGAEDEYEDSIYGLQSSDVAGATLSIDYAFNPNTSLYGFVSRELIESDLFGIEGTNPWHGNTEDRIGTAGAGFSTAISDDKRVGIDVIWAGTKGEIDVVTGNEAPFPDLESSLINVRLNFSHDVNDRWGYRLYAEFEDFDASDWAYDGIGVDGVDAVLTYGLNSPNYEVINLQAQAVYRF